MCKAASTCKSRSPHGFAFCHLRSLALDWLSFWIHWLLGLHWQSHVTSSCDLQKELLGQRTLPTLSEVCSCVLMSIIAHAARPAWSLLCTWDGNKAPHWAPTGRWVCSHPLWPRSMSDLPRSSEPWKHAVVKVDLYTESYHLLYVFKKKLCIFNNYMAPKGKVFLIQMWSWYEILQEAGHQR